MIVSQGSEMILSTRVDIKSLENEKESALYHEVGKEMILKQK